MVTFLLPVVAMLTLATAPDSLPQSLREVLPDSSTDEIAAHVVEPAGLACDPFGRLWITDAREHRVVRFDIAGHWLGSEGALGSDAGQFRHPGAVVRLGALDIGVLDRENRRIARYDTFGHFKDVLVDLADPALEQSLGRIDPVDLASDAGGGIAVADHDGERVLRFDFSGRFERALGGFGTEPGSFRGLAAIAFLPHGELLTVERDGSRLQRFDPAGRVLAGWPLDSLSAGAGLSVTASDSGRVALADAATARVWVFDGVGHRLAQSRGVVRALALAFLPDGTLLAIESPTRLRRLRLTAAPRDTTRSE